MGQRYREGQGIWGWVEILNRMVRGGEGGSLWLAGDEHSRLRKQYVQRPWGESLSAVISEQLGGQGG